MFCPYCGTKMVDNASFCINCGKQIVSSFESTEPMKYTANIVEAQVQQYQAQKNAIRKSELNTLTTAYSHFSKKANQFKEYDSVCDRLNYYARGSSNALLIWGSIITTFAWLLAVVAIIGDARDSWIVLLPLSAGVLMIIGGILTKVFWRRKQACVIERYAQLSKELYNHYIMCPNCPVGPEYANPEILRQFLTVLQSGRADTVKESINIVIEGKNKAKVQEYLAAIEQNTSQIKVATFFAAARFFI